MEGKKITRKKKYISPSATSLLGPDNAYLGCFGGSSVPGHCSYGGSADCSSECSGGTGPFDSI